MNETENRRDTAGDTKPDPINHPVHYTSHPSGIEVIEITEHMNFCLGNVIKYTLRCGLKGDGLASAVEDLKKARWYIDREIQRLERQRAAQPPEETTRGTP